LTAPEAAAVSLDCVAKPPGEGAPEGKSSVHDHAAGRKAQRSLR
jgi:hypothetical protein